MRERLPTTFLSLLMVLASIHGWSQNFIVEEFRLHTPDGIQLAGDLHIPAGQGTHAAVLLIWGNGPHTRAVEISGSPIFKQLAEYLVQRNMIVLRMDKRGFGNSTGIQTESEGNYTTRDLTEDFKLAYAFLKKHPGVDTARIGLIGHSEGSAIASMLAAETPGLGWVIVFGPMAVPGDSLFLEQKKLAQKKLAIPDSTSVRIAAVWETYIDFIKSGNGNDSVYYEIGKSFLMAHGLAENDPRITRQFIDQLLDGYKTPWYSYFFKWDPAAYLTRIKMPFLAIFGGMDEQTTPEQNLLPLNQLLRTSGNTDYRIIVLADEDHFFIRRQNKRQVKHTPGEMELSDALLNAITSWLTEHAILPAGNK